MKGIRDDFDRTKHFTANYILDRQCLHTDIAIDERRKLKGNAEMTSYAIFTHIPFSIKNESACKNIYI